MPVWFHVESIELPTRWQSDFRRIDKSELQEIWTTWKHAKHRGVYVLAMRAGRGVTPWYVGKTAGQSFKARISQHKDKFENIINRAGKGTPILFFFVRSGKGSAIKAIRKLEEYVITEAYKSNSELENEQGIKEPYFAIKGLAWRNGKSTGRPNAALTELKKAMIL